MTENYKFKRLYADNKAFDWKTLIASLIFFFVALTNIRDFPIPNVPLIYPAFLFFIIFLGLDKLYEGIRRTRFLCILVIIFWSYTTLIYLIKSGGTIDLGDVAYLLEPLLIFIAAGVATTRPGGARASLWAFVFVITLSTAGGIWIYFIGDPVESWRLAMHSSMSGDIFQGRTTGDVTVTKDLIYEIKRNIGMSSQVFSFSYQLAIANIIVLSLLLTTKRTLILIHLYLLGSLLILLIGIITNAERGPIVSISAGLLCLFIFERTKFLNLRTIIFFILGILIVLAILNYSSTWEDRFTIHNRALIKQEKTFLRAIIMPKTAIESIFYEPLGAGMMSDHYAKVAYDKGWTKKIGPNPISSHNHFANIIMYSGIVGLLLTIALFWGLLKRIRKISVFRLSGFNEEFILIFACITALVHSLFQNTGFFKADPSTQIIFGLLWGATAKITYPRFSNLLKKWIID
jgi:hypothetical protein